MCDVGFAEHRLPYLEDRRLSVVSLSDHDQETLEPYIAGNDRQTHKLLEHIDAEVAIADEGKSVLESSDPQRTSGGKVDGIWQCNLGEVSWIVLERLGGLKIEHPIGEYDQRPR